MNNTHNFEHDYQTLIQAGTSPSTHRGYVRDVRYFWTWAKVRFDMTTHYPVTSDTVIAFILDHINGLPEPLEETLVKGGHKRPGPRKVSSIRRYLSSLSIIQQEHGHASLLTCPKVKLLLRRARKARATTEQPHQKAALTSSLLETLLATCDDSLIGIRDRALLLVGFTSGGRRRSELASLRVEDIRRIDDGYLLRLRTSKTDQLGEGQEVPVLGDAAHALTTWLVRSGLRTGKLFRGIKSNDALYDGITGNAINNIVKRRAKAAGLDPKAFGAHSLRAGFMTEAGRQGYHVKDAMQLSGHVDIDTAMRYYRQVALLDNPTTKLIK